MNPDNAVPWVFRRDVRPGDLEAVAAVLESSGFFLPGEVAVGVELVEEALRKGKESGYFFIFADLGSRLAGYCCYGPIPCTEGSFDLYWIAVDQELRARGLGRTLMAAAEKEIAEQGGRAVYIETSSRPLYEPTRAFYLACAYRTAAVLKDFYRPGDDKYIFVKQLAGHEKN